ncbi:MAG: TlpA disulfide reductase family protein [Ferruginibacter sp.]
MFTKVLLIFVSILFPFMSKPQAVPESFLVKLHTEFPKKSTEGLGACFTKIYKGNIMFKGIPDFLTKNNSIIKSIYFGRSSPINNTIFLMIGDKNERERICIVDANNNHDFSDDYQYVFDKDSIINLKNIAQPMAFSCDYHSQNLQRKIYLRPNFYPGSLTFSNPLEQKYFVTFILAEYKAGNFRFNKREYAVAAIMRSPRAVYDTETVFSIIDINKTFPSNLDLDFHALNQSVFLKNSKFKISAITPAGDSLYITCENDTGSKRIGFVKGNYAPNIVGKTLKDGMFKINDYKGKFKLIDFWGTWCIPCIRLIPSIRSIHAKYKNLIIISIACEDKGPQVARLATKKYKMDWINLYEPFKGNQLLIKDFQISNFPTTFLIDPTGKIIFRGNSKDFNSLEGLLEKIYLNTNL